MIDRNDFDKRRILRFLSDNDGETDCSFNLVPPDESNLKNHSDGVAWLFAVNSPHGWILDRQEAVTLAHALLTLAGERV